MEMEEHIWDTSGSYLRGIAVYFLYSPNARKKTLFWRDAKIGFIYSLWRRLRDATLSKIKYFLTWNFL